MFFSIFLGKKNAEIIKFLGISKEMSPRIKNIFAQERKPMFGLKIYFCLSHNFQNYFLTQIIYCIIHRCLCSHFKLFLFFYISL